MNDFFDLLSEGSCEINVSMGSGIRTRLVLPDREKESAQQLLQPVMKGTQSDAPRGIIPYLTRECRVRCGLPSS
jgi:hypothetical protein